MWDMSAHVVSKGFGNISDLMVFLKIRFVENDWGFFLSCLRYPGVSKDESYWFWQSWTRPKIPKL